MHIDEVENDEKPGWKLFIDGAANMKGVGIGAVLISEIGQHYHVIAQLRFYCTNNMTEYEVCIFGLRLVVDMGVQEVLVLGDLDLLVHQIQGEWETRDLKLILYRQCRQDLCQWFRSVEFSQGSSDQVVSWSMGRNTEVQMGKTDMLKQQVDYRALEAFRVSWLRFNQTVKHFFDSRMQPSRTKHGSGKATLSKNAAN
uniref:Uncharacterized protein LOC104233659 n=1 Tax=Nicotiana sylvestris TaxID=4096 RepID=A0A1U7X3F6_NICSY|nr:PREDICTED: uncharacterized protein LOC104233659 [Nicotiana sylvestris]